MEEVYGLMKYRYNVSCSETLAENWTPTAIDCFEIGCRCSSCLLNKLYFNGDSSKCMMKYTVIELVRKKGKPDTKGEK